MQVEILIEGFEKEATKVKNLKDSVEKLLADYIADIGLPENAVHRVFIADDKHFGSAVNQVKRGSKFTQNEIYIAAGKTLFHELDNGSESNSIIFRAELIERLLNISAKTEEINSWPVDSMLYRYVIYHELGHCCDNLVRSQFSETSLTNSLGQFKISQVAKYYSRILVGEFAACIFSAKAMTPTLFEFDHVQTINSVNKMLHKIQEKTRQYDGDMEKLYELAFDVSGVFWTILIQYSKLIGSQIGNDSLHESRICLWESGNAKTAELFSQFYNALIEIWSHYPDWTDEYLELFVTIWDLFTVANGYKFIEGENEDGIFW